MMTTRSAPETARTRSAKPCSQSVGKGPDTEPTTDGVEATIRANVVARSVARSSTACSACHQTGGRSADGDAERQHEAGPRGDLAPQATRHRASGHRDSGHGAILVPMVVRG
jgi:hypothetical protein